MNGRILPECFSSPVWELSQKKEPRMYRLTLFLLLFQRSTGIIAVSPWAEIWLHR